MSETSSAASAVIETSKGTIHLRLFPEQAPVTVASFANLANRSYYDGLNFHRVIDGFVAQGGCPTGNGMGGSGTNIPAEFNAEPHVRGTMSMARSADPNSASSQFFICLDEVPYLNNQYTVWGQVESGMEHVDALPNAPCQVGLVLLRESGQVDVDVGQVAGLARAELDRLDELALQLAHGHVHAGVHVGAHVGVARRPSTV